MESHSDPAGGLDGVTPTHPLSTGKRKVVRRTPAGGGSGGGAADVAADSVSDAGAMAAPSPASLPAASATQTVSSEAEGNALIKRIRQLESEGAMLSNTLTKVCDENGRLSGLLSTLEEKVHTLAQEPMKGTSVLHSLFEPEKTGWFGGSKSAAREQLQQLSDALQSEFMAYKASHTSSNDEVQALLEGLHSAHTNAQELANVTKDQQQLISRGPLAVAVHIVPFDESISGAATVRDLQEQLRRVREQATLAEDQLRTSQAEVRSLKVENTKLRNEAIAKSVAAAPVVAPVPVPVVNSGPSPSEKAATEALARMTRERDALQEALAQARNEVVEQKRDAALQRQLVAQLENKLTAKDSVHAEEMEKLRHQLADSFSASMVCRRCDDLREELEKARREVDKSHTTVQDLRSQIVDMAVKQEQKYTALEKKLADSLGQLSEKDQQLRLSTTSDDYEHLKAEQESLTREIDLYRQRVSFLEANRGAAAAAAADEPASTSALDETAVLETLQDAKDRVSKLEFERDQLSMQLEQAQSYAVSRDAEARQLQQRSEDDKQRVAFLVKKCATLTADARGATAQLDTFKEQFEKQSLELKQEKRNTETMAKLQKQLDDLSKEKKLLEDRLAATQEVEERLVKAKETIAYMELAQSSTISMSQFAELRAEKEKLQNTMAPLNRKLEEAKQEIERLRSVTDAQQAISSTQNNNVRTWQDQVTALGESEAKLRDKVGMLTTENTRLTQVNASLEQQMNDMQDGIKEMAVHMERDRSSAKAAAEASSQKQIQTLRDELAQARATIAEVQARDGQYVAEGLYQSVVTEREKAAEENKRIAFELEKRKSEITIYRQTIADLEQENEERVKEIETLQDRYQGDRTTLNDRLAKEQKRAAELTGTVASLSEQVTAMEAEAAKRATAAAEMQEKIVKQQRAFEDKCRREEALSDEIKRLNNQITALQTNSAGDALSRQASTGSAGIAHADVAAATAAATAAAAAAVAATPPMSRRGSSAVAAKPEKEVRAADCVVSSPSLAAPVSPTASVSPAAFGADAETEPPASDAMRQRIYNLQQENDRLAGELKRTQLQYRSDSAEDQHMITVLQTQVRNRMSPNDRTAYEAEIAKSAALKKSTEALMEENVKLRQQVGGPAPPPPPASMTRSASSVAVAGAQQMDVLQLQAQLQSQKASSDAATEAYEARIQELEEQLHEAEEAAAAAAAAEDGDPGPLGKPVRRKVKKTKKKKTLAEQVGAVDDGEDILALSPPTDALAVTTPGMPDAGQLQTSLMLAQREVTQLKAENMQLKASIAELTTQLRRAEEDVHAAHEDLDTAQAAMDAERRDFQKQLAFLQDGVPPPPQQLSVEERQMSGRSANNSFGANGGGGAGGKTNRSFRNTSIADSEMQLRRCQDEVERLTAENKNLVYQLERAGAQLKSPSTATAAAVAVAEKSGAGDVRKLQRQLRQKDAEIKALADQLMPTKETLVEYMAMADRLGLQYPFPAELEGATVLRLKALHVPLYTRSVSAPSPAPQRNRSNRSPGRGDDSAPSPRTPRARRAGANASSLRQEDEDFSLR
ncbi:hypothetical protein NESM_000723600 [Novymonas esmeraldas]|uniref:Nucleoprotein TPR/MLP1 domain-containing protein n=1 Tax=Novymonas esmeraldas TaxID=1808958 RepID=A0AAW0EVV7_9TRYP